MSTAPRTAILYFAFSPEEEAKRKPLLPGHGGGTDVRLYRLLQQALSDKVAPLGLPVLHFDEQRQRGSGFGQRMVHAIQDAFGEGYDRLIILGNDIPELKTEHIQAALESLGRKENYLIRTDRGGAGLIGIQAKNFHPEVWTELDWQGDRMFDDLFDVIPDCKVHRDVLLDINVLGDAFQYLHEYRGRDEVADYLAAILLPVLGSTDSDERAVTAPGSSAFRLRGPPYAS